jgi:RND family efflux transporter MFP subunit
MAEAQGAVVVAAREWQRVRSLGRKVVAESRYIEAQIAQQQSRAKAISYGMTSEQVDTLLRKGASKADGSFILLSPRAGTVVADDFIIGEIVEAGRALFEITDESLRWVEAGFSPTDAGQIHIGDVAHIRIGSDRMSGRVSQIHHVLDETTRTRAVRIEVPDPEHRLHPGEFVDVAIEAGEGAPVLALPEEAVLRSQDGDWQVFVAGDEPGAYRPVEVDRRYATGGLAVVDGIAAGTEVVTHGAFFLASELAKGGFDPHNH